MRLPRPGTQRRVRRSSMFQVSRASAARAIACSASVRSAKSLLAMVSTSLQERITAISSDSSS